MEKGKRYVMEGLGAWNCDAIEDPDGAWLYDPDKEIMSRAVAIAANARADCYEEQMKDMATGFDKLEKRNLKLLADRETAEGKTQELIRKLDTAEFLVWGKKDLIIMLNKTIVDLQEKVGFLEKQVTDLDAFLQEKKQRILELERYAEDLVERSRILRSDKGGSP